MKYLKVASKISAQIKVMHYRLSIIGKNVLEDFLSTSKVNV